MVTATVDGLASNLALTVPLALIVLFGVLGSASEYLLIPRRSGERTEAERDRARQLRACERRARLRREDMSPIKERERSA